jgi:hypothetical protein
MFDLFSAPISVQFKLAVVNCREAQKEGSSQEARSKKDEEMNLCDELTVPNPLPAACRFQLSIIYMHFALTDGIKMPKFS